MSDDDLVDQFLDAALDTDEVDANEFAGKGGDKLSSAMRVHELLLKAGEASQEEERPRKLGRFEVVGDLGAGGLGRVYLGWDPDLRRYVAIKVIARDRWAINEARSIAQLDHRSIVKVYEVGRDRLVMELLDGGSLQERLEGMRNGSEDFLIPLRARLHCLVRIAEGLAYCHERGILHRDVKPGNVMFAKDDEHPRLVDFGLAHLDELESLDITQNLVGSPAYLAPEQVESGETGTDQRSDVFSFGVLAYELLTLSSPFRRSTRTATLQAVTIAKLQPAQSLNAEIPRPMVDILEHCLEPSPDDRYQSMDDVVGDLLNALADRPISIGSRSTLHKSKLLLKRNRRVAGFAAAGVTLAGGTAIVLWLGALRSERESFRLRLGELDRQLSSLTTAEEVLDAGIDLLLEQARSRQLDSSFFGRELFLECVPLIDTSVEGWSRYVGEQVNALAKFEKRIYPPIGWLSLRPVDRQLIGEPPWNESWKDRGRVTITEGLDGLVIYVMPDLEADSRLGKRVTLPEFPEVGYYRVEMPGVWQREFHIDTPWHEPIVIAPPERRLPTEGWFEWEERGLLVGPLLSTDVLWDYLEAESIRRSPRPEGQELAAPSLSRALGCAAWNGGRIPTGEELGALLSMGLIDPEAPHGSELISDIHPMTIGDTGSILDYSKWQSCPGEHPNRWVRDLQLEAKFTLPGKSITPGFRILYLLPAK